MYFCACQTASRQEKKKLEQFVELNNGTVVKCLDWSAQLFRPFLVLRMYFYIFPSYNAAIPFQVQYILENNQIACW